MTATTLPRIIRCRMLDNHGDRCTGEALWAEGEVRICARHAGLVMEAISAQAALIRVAGRRAA